MGCRRVAPADELLRVVRTPDGALVVGRTLPGRGAWLCEGSPACVRTAEKRRAFGRALRGHVRPDAIEALRTHVAERARMVGRHHDG
ncbi:MAG TPA: YlxR family protein [Acidimicrobiales bacterium]|nr:YlxR family protein [Acidimicrobiales bacterium]